MREIQVFRILWQKFCNGNNNDKREVRLIRERKVGWAREYQQNKINSRA